MAGTFGESAIQAWYLQEADIILSKQLYYLEIWTYSERGINY